MFSECFKPKRLVPRETHAPTTTYFSGVIQERRVTSIQHIRLEAEVGPGALAESKAVGSSPGSPLRCYLSLPQPRLPLLSLCPLEDSGTIFKLWAGVREESLSSGTKPHAFKP